MKPIVIPNDEGATLGGVLGQLRADPPNFQILLQDHGIKNQIESVDALEKMLHLIWPNPDRHGSATIRTPSQAEAETVVHLAVTIVQWARGGVLVKR